MQKNKTGIIISIFVFIFGVLLPVFIWKFGNDFNYYIKPIIWLFLLLITYLFLKKRNRTFNFNKKAIFELTLISSLIYIISYFSLGLVIGYSKSPFDRSLFGILKNLWVFLPFIISREIIRDSIIKSSVKGYKSLIIIITIIFIFTDIPYANFETYSKTIADVVEFSIKTFMPAACLNIFLSYLCYRESYKSSIIYLLPIKIIYVLTPVFTNDIFFVTIIIDLLIPIFTFWKIENFYNIVGIVSIYEKNEVKTKVKRSIVFVILGFILAFTTRILPISPIVIVSDSMNPYIEKGDLAIIQKLDSSKIKINDIIEYRLDDIYVIHRVINIKNTNNGKIYITKGDSNKSFDVKPVKENQINGKLVGNIPKIGYPTIWLREFLEYARGVRIKEGDGV